MVNSAVRRPAPEGANWMAMSDSPPAGMARGKVGAGVSVKSVLPLDRVMDATFKGAVPTLNSCTGTVRLEPVVTVPKPAVEMGFVARRWMRLVVTPVPLAGIIRVAWVGSLEV